MVREAHIGADDERKVVGVILVVVQGMLVIFLVGKGLAVAPIWRHLAIL